MYDFSIGDIIELLREFFAFVLTLTSMILCYTVRNKADQGDRRRDSKNEK